jgi:hypothetical protein
MNPDDPISRIQQKRQDQANLDLEQSRTDSIIGAVNQSSSQTTDALSKSMHDILMATMIGKDPRIAEVATNLTELLKSIAIARQDLDKSGISEIKDTFEMLLSAMSDLPDKVAATDKSDELIPYLKDVSAAVRSIRFNPNVTVTPAKVDLTSLENTLKEVLSTPEAEGIDLECYKAHDIDNTDPNIQYVGFVNESGAWYIMENNSLENSLRYKFGKKNYQTAFPKASTFGYRILSEAINEV